MRYGLIKWNDVADGPGVRVALFVSGCRYHCKGCQNQEAQSFDFGELYTQETKVAILRGLSKKHIQGLTLLGGEPLEKENVPELYSLVRDVKFEYNDSKDIWLYTGGVLENVWDECDQLTRNFIKQLDVVVDGPFVLQQRDPGLAFRGSHNQRIIDIHNWLRGGNKWNLTSLYTR